MTSAEMEEIRAIIKAELGPYKVNKEQHYLDHTFLKEFRKWYDNINSTFWKSIVISIVGFLFGIMLLGFVVWSSFYGGK